MFAFIHLRKLVSAHDFLTRWLVDLFNDVSAPFPLSTDAILIVDEYVNQGGIFFLSGTKLKLR